MFGLATTVVQFDRSEYSRHCDWDRLRLSGLRFLEMHLLIEGRVYLSVKLRNIHQSCEFYEEISSSIRFDLTYRRS